MKRITVLVVCIAGFVLLTGCSTYRKHIAPKIPAVSIQADVGGEGLGAEVGFSSRWTGEKRERDVSVTPDVD